MVECIAIAGWAHDGSCWEPVRSALEDQVTWRDVSWADLCRHGAQSALEGTPGGAPLLLVGWSLGALLALQATLTQPQSVAALVLAGATARFTADDDYPGTSVRELRALRALCRRAPHDALAGFFERCLAPRSDPAEVQRRTQRACALPADDVQLGLDVLGRTDVRGELQRVRCPVRLVHGDTDGVIPAEHGQWLSARLPNAALHIVPGAGHDLAGDLAAEVIRAVRAAVDAVLSTGDGGQG